MQNLFFKKRFCKRPLPGFAWNGGGKPTPYDMQEIRMDKAVFRGFVRKRGERLISSEGKFSEVWNPFSKGFRENPAKNFNRKRQEILHLVVGIFVDTRVENLMAFPRKKAGNGLDF